MSFWFNLVFILMLAHMCMGSADWDYSAHGPDVWSERYPSCAGERQSPINIQTECTQYKSFDQFDLTSDHSQPMNFVVENNGHTITATVKANDTKLSIYGADLVGTFYFRGFHVHWGPNHNSGSEHQINGVKFSGESHFVYENPSTNKRAVLGFLMLSRESRQLRSGNKSGSSNPKADSEWEKYFNAARNLTKEHDSMNVTFTLTSLMGNQLNEFYRYDGSLTTPPCTENAIWTIFKDPIQILDYDFESLRHDLFYESYRGPQPLYYRTVQRSFSTEIPAPTPDQKCCNSNSNAVRILTDNSMVLLCLFCFYSLSTVLSIHF